MSEITDPAAVLAFWREAGEAAWFTPAPAFDARIAARFSGTLAAALRGGLAAWEETPDGALALVIVLDQFPRNLHRGTPQAYAGDAAALDVADRAVARGHDAAVETALRRFFYLPFMHAEDAGAQARSVALNEALGEAEPAHYARHHRDIVARFGRFPHRNAVLGRASSVAEIDYLAAEDAFRG